MNKTYRDAVLGSSSSGKRRLELLAQVKAYALEHYEEGFDVFVEAYTDQELSEAIGKANTLRGALYKLRPITQVRADRMADAMVEGAV